VTWLHALSLHLYRLLLYLYPAEHRRAYGPLMAQTFGDLCREAAQRKDVLGWLALWVRTLSDLFASASREHLDAIERNGLFGAQKRACVPLPWAQVGLSLLPGFLALSASGMRGVDGQMPLLGLVLCALLGVVGLLWERKLAAWSLVGAGVLLGATAPEWFLLLGPIAFVAAVGYLIWRQRRRRRSPTPESGRVPGVVWALSGLMVAGLSVRLGWSEPWLSLWYGVAVTGVTLGCIVLGLPLARRYGLVGGLLPVGASFVLWEVMLDLTYCIWKTPWGITIMAILAAGLLIVSPMWVARARSTRGQVWGLLLPPTVALLSVSAIDALVRTQITLLDRVVNYPALYPAQNIVHGCGGHSGLDPIPALIDGGIESLSLFLGLVMMVVLYHPPRTRDSAADPQPDDALWDKLAPPATGRGERHAW
jgi:hypothetical protein